MLDDLRQPIAVLVVQQWLDGSCSLTEIRRFCRAVCYSAATLMALVDHGSRRSLYTTAKHRHYIELRDKVLTNYYALLLVIVFFISLASHSSYLTDGIVDTQTVPVTTSLCSGMSS